MLSDIFTGSSIGRLELLWGKGGPMITESLLGGSRRAVQELSLRVYVCGGCFCAILARVLSVHE